MLTQTDKPSSSQAMLTVQARPMPAASNSLGANPHAGEESEGQQLEVQDDEAAGKPAAAAGSEPRRRSLSPDTMQKAFQVHRAITC